MGVLKIVNIKSILQVHFKNNLKYDNFIIYYTYYF